MKPQSKRSMRTTGTRETSLKPADKPTHLPHVRRFWTNKKVAEFCIPLGRRATFQSGLHQPVEAAVCGVRRICQHASGRVCRSIQPHHSISCWPGKRFQFR